jgi:hypothetical protein
MTPEQITHKVSLIKELYVENDQENKCVIATLRIKVKSGKIYAFNFMVNPVFGDIQSGKRPILDFFLFSQRMTTLPEFLTTFNDTDPNDPIKTFGFAQNKEDFIHYKQTADIQLNANQRVKDFIKIGFFKSIERVMINKKFIHPLDNPANEPKP